MDRLCGRGAVTRKAGSFQMAMGHRANSEGGRLDFLPHAPFPMCHLPFGNLACGSAAGQIQYFLKHLQAGESRRIVWKP